MTAETINGPHIPQWDMADRMRKTMREHDVSVHDVAEYFGVSRNTISNWINGRVAPSVANQRLWAFRFGVPLEWLRDGVVTSRNPPDGGLPHLDSNQKPFDYRLGDAPHRFRPRAVA